MTRLGRTDGGPRLHVQREEEEEEGGARDYKCDVNDECLDLFFCISETLLITVFVGAYRISSSVISTAKASFYLDLKGNANLGN